MNKQRRERIDEIRGQLTRIESEIATLRDDEQEALDAMPESLQRGERGEKSQEAIDAMDQALDVVNEAIDSLSDAMA